MPRAIYTVFNNPSHFSFLYPSSSPSAGGPAMQTWGPAAAATTATATATAPNPLSVTRQLHRQQHCSQEQQQQQPQKPLATATFTSRLLRQFSYVTSDSQEDEDEEEIIPFVQPPLRRCGGGDPHNPDTAAVFRTGYSLDSYGDRSADDSSSSSIYNNSGAAARATRREHHSLAARSKSLNAPGEKVSPANKDYSNGCFQHKQQQQLQSSSHQNSNNASAWPLTGKNNEALIDHQA